MSEEDVEHIAAAVGETFHAGGTLVFRQGDPAAQVHVVRSGTVELSRMLSGRRVTLQLLKPGDVFGDVPLLLGEAEPFDARAVSDATVLSLDAASLFAMLATRPRVAQRWMVSLAERMAGLQQRLVDLLAGDLEAQLASVLLQQADARGDVALSQKQMAELLGVQRTSVQRVLKQLEDAQLVKIAYRRVTVLDGPGLLTLFATE